MDFILTWLNEALHVRIPYGECRRREGEGHGFHLSGLEVYAIEPTESLLPSNRRADKLVHVKLRNFVSDVLPCIRDIESDRDILICGNLGRRNNEGWRIRTSCNLSRIRTATKCRLG
jgi:hypothetical protein